LSLAALDMGGSTNDDDHNNSKKFAAGNRGGREKEAATLFVLTMRANVLMYLKKDAQVCRLTNFYK
jgi:hypothetical protein